MKKFYSLFLILTALLCSGNVWGASPLTVADGSATENHSPVWGDWLNAASRSQVLYPASLLSEMENSNITSMTFYLSSSASAAWTSEFTIGLAVVEESSFAYDGGYYSNTYYYNSAATTTVYTGTLDGTGSTMVITFDTPFLYEGGNLLVNFSATGGIWKDATFAGETQTAYLSIASHSGAEVTSTGYGYQFLPKTSFAYTEAAPITCAKPTTVTVAEENIGSNSATITLAGLNNATVEYKKKSATDYIVAETAVTGTSYELTGLDSYTEYDIQVKNVCGGTDGESKYVKASFRTKCGPKTIPFEAYGFDDITYSYGQYAIPACWDKIASGNYPYVYNYYSHSSSNCLYFYGGKSTSEQAIIFPDFTASLAGYTLTFYHRESVDENWYGTNYVYAHFEVGYVLNNAFTTISGPLEQLSAYAESPTEVAFTQALPEGAKLAIRYAGGDDTGSGYIDDIAIKVTPSCEKPTLNNATDQTFEGATFTWDGSAAQYQYAVVASGASVESWSEPTSEKTYTITGQAAATTFDFYVRSYCSSTEQSDGVKKSFTTVAVTAPTAPQVANASTTTADLSWTAAAGVSGYQYVAALSGQEPDWNNAQNTTATSVQLTNLLAGNTYKAYVRSFYSNNNCYSATVASDDFETQCEAKTIDADHSFTETFDALHCWTLTNCVSNTGINNNVFRFWYGYSNQYLISPELDTEDRQVTIEFDYHKHTSGTETFMVGYSTTTKEVSAFTFGDVITSTNTSDLKHSENLPAGVKYIAIAYTSYDQYYFYIDNFKVTEYVAPSCAKPTTLNEAADITPEGATFSWEGDADFFQYICVAGGTAEGDIDWTASTKVAKSATNQVVLSGKAAGTYDFYVRSWCSESEQSEALKKSFTTETVAVPTIGTITTTNNSANASWTAPTGISYCQWSLNGTDWSEPTSELNAAITSLEQNTNYTFYVRSYYDASHQSAEVTKAFTTECDPIAVSAEISETFDDITSGIPACWKNNEGTTTNESYKWNSATGGQSDRCVRFESRNNGTGKTNILASPLFELSADADLSFYVKNYKGGDYKVQIAVDGGAREDLFTDLTNIQNWTKKEAALTAYNGHTIQFFFCGTSNWSESSNGYLYLDEFKITPAACRKPASRPVASDVTANSATLTWGISAAAAYQYSLVEAGNAPAWEDIDTNTKTFDNLQPTTTYDFAVRSACGGADFSDTLMVSFRTDCGTYALPFEEDFDGIAANAIPECWDNEEGTSTDYYKWKGVTYSGHNMTTCVRFNSSTNDNGNTNILATPTIQLGEGNMLTFYAKNPTGGDFKVQIKEEGETAVDLLTTGLTGIADWTRKYANIPADYNNKKVQILFHATSNEGDQNAYIYIDEVRVSKGIGLADNVDNSETLSNNNGQTLDVVVGRTFTREGYDTNPDHYNTICLPFSLSAEEFAASPLADGQLWAFKYAVVENEELLFRIVEADHIEAGKPYFIGFEAGSNIINPLFEDVTIAASVGQSVGDGNVAQLHGILEPETFTAGDQTKLFLYTQTNTLYWWNGSADSQLNGFRAFFQVSGGSSSAPIRHGMRARIVKEEQVITDVENVLLNNETIKRLEDNRVVIIRNGVKYNAQGQLISK